MFTGVYTALATPFTKQGQVDYPVLERLIQAQLAARIEGFVLLGTTAEAATLSAEEKTEILRFCTPRIKGRHLKEPFAH